MRISIKLFWVFCFLIFLIILSTFYIIPVNAQSPSPEINYQEKFYQAEVIYILEEGEKQIWEIKNPYQKVKLKILDGDKKNEEVIIDHGSTFQLTNNQRVRTDEKVIILGRTNIDNQFEYHIIDKYRMDKILIILFAFFALVLAISRWKGLGSIIGLTISFLIITRFIVPNILNGKDPVLISIIGSFAIAVSTIYLAHGFSKKTGVAVFSTLLALSLTGILANLFVNIARLTGLGSEAAYGLRFGNTGDINIQGLLLGGIIIGALGVLDDVTTTQSASVFELHKTNPALKFRELFKKGMNIGREHIASVVNTLVLAYTGVSLPIFIFLINNPTGQPVWFLLNSESITEEIIRTLAGSFGLVLAVPITTFIATWAATRKQ